MNIEQRGSAGVLSLFFCGACHHGERVHARNLIGDVRSPDAGPPLAFSLNGARSFRVAGEKPWVAVGDL